MWTFRDKGNRDCCLIPEATGIIQELWRSGWSKSRKRPCRVFYVTRCFRYEKPQLGRYREFTQVGAEILGGRDEDIETAIESLKACLLLFSGDLRMKFGVRRGPSYYTEEGFEVECPDLGAQKQVAGGGRYPEGVGWAIGLERLLLAGEAGEKP